MVVFGLPQTLEQLPQRAVPAAGDPAVGHRGGGPSRPGALPHGATGGALGLLLVEAQAHQPAARLLPVSDTLARPVRLLGHAMPGDILVSPEVGRLVGEWYGLRARQGARAPGRLIKPWPTASSGSAHDGPRWSGTGNDP